MLQMGLENPTLACTGRLAGTRRGGGPKVRLGCEVGIHSLGTVTHTQLPVQIFQMVFHRVDGDSQIAGNLGGGSTGA